MIVGYGIHPVFAQTTTADTSYLDGLAKVIDDLMKVASRAWIPLATLAGKFMSNDMIYGNRLHLDAYLWQMRNISKNFANFGILWFLLYEIANTIMGKKSNFATVIKNSVIAGIAIQMSWFLVWSIVDVSTIATTAVGSFPASFLSNSTAGSSMDNMITEIKKWTIELDEKAYPTLKPITAKDDESASDTKAKFMPKYDSVAWPLIFIWASAFRIQDMMTLNEGQDTNAKSMLITNGLKWIILILYVVVLALLLIANIIRVWYLRIFIALSPIIILMAVFLKDQWLGKDWLAKALTLKNFIVMVFKPTLFVAVLGLILIFVASIQSILIGSSDINGTTITQTSNGSTLAIQWIASVTTSEKIVSSIGGTAQNIIPNLIVYFATLFLLWLLVKIALSKGDDPIAGIMNKSTEMIESSAKNIPIMGGLGYNKMKEKSEEMKQQTTNAMAQEYFWKEVSFDNISWKFEDKKFTNAMNSLTGTKNGWSATDLKTLETTAQKWWDIFTETKALIEKNKSSIGSDDNIYAAWKTHFETRLKTSKDKFGIKATTFDDLIEADWKIIHEKLWGDMSIKKIPTTEELFRKYDYTKK